MNIYTTLKAADCVTITADLVKGMPRDPDSPILVFCESKSSLSYETAIAKATGGTFNVDVTSFSRYLSKRVKVDKYLSKAQGALLIRKIMGELSDCLVRIKPNAFNVPRDVYELISQLKSAMVTPEDLYRVIKEEGGALKTKLGDVATIYGAYEKFLKESSLTDEGGFLSLMPAAVKEDEGLKGARVIISGIQSFTRQTLEIVKALSRAASVDFVFASGPYECFTNESVNKISELFKSARVIRLEGRLPWEITAISRGMFNPIAFTGQPKNSDLIEVYSCPDLKTECEQVAARIRRMVVEDGLRYRDFTVLCPSVDTYGPILAQCLDNCEVRYFINKTEGLDKHGVNGLIGGFLISYIGTLIGSVIAFSIGKLFGKKAAEWCFGKDKVEKYSDVLNKKGKVPFILMQLLPFFPDDILCMVAGLSTMSYKFFTVVMVLVKPIYIFLVCLMGTGDIMPKGGWGVALYVIIFGGFLLVSFLYFKYQDKIDGYFKGKFSKKDQ